MKDPSASGDSPERRTHTEDRRASRRPRRLGLKILLSLAFTVVLLECGAAVVIYTGLIPARLPSFRIPGAQQPFFVDIDPNFGAWHPPNRTFEHRRACFSTRYRSNSYGAIDVEREQQAEGSRTIVLGDSFATGHGVIETDRFSNRLEELTGIPHMNFAAGGTGPTQYFMVYKHLARDFEHDRVLVSILPANDFFDDRPSNTRYRPYWDGEHPDYTLRYSLESPEQSQHHPSRQELGVTAHDILGSFSFFYNAADWVAGARKLMRSRQSDPSYAGYFDFTEDEFLRLRHSLAELHALVPHGRLAVMAIPRYLDVMRYREEGTNPFGAAMTRAAIEVGFEFVDMLPLMAEAYDGRERELFLGCDGHWSPEGHDFAARALQRRLYR